MVHPPVVGTASNSSSSVGFGSSVAWSILKTGWLLKYMIRIRILGSFALLCRLISRPETLASLFHRLCSKANSMSSGSTPASSLPSIYKTTSGARFKLSGHRGSSFLSWYRVITCLFWPGCAICRADRLLTSGKSMKRRWNSVRLPSCLRACCIA